MKKARKHERGVALLMVLFALMIISALALSMLFSSDTETMISTNYRDKQSAIYGALSGLQEGRARIHPKFGDLYPDSIINTSGVKAPVLTPPNGAPTGYHVLYIVNGDDVKPWDPTNKYFDTELCQERVLGLSGTPGIPCSGSTAVPSGTSWYKVYDNSSNVTNWTQDKPLYRWVRVMLKTNSMSPLRIPDVVGASTPTYSGKQLCFDGTHQVLVDPLTGMCGPPTNTSSGGGVTAVTANIAGSGYDPSAPPAVTLSGGGGLGAQATANLTASLSGTVSYVKLTAAGTGYTSTPTVTIDPPGTGDTATASAILPGWPVSSVAVTASNPATCFDASATPQISFDNTGAAAGAKAHAVMGGTACVYKLASVKLTGGCKAPAAGTYPITATGGSGSGFAGTVVVSSSGTITPSTVSNPGSYTSMPTGISGLCTKGSASGTFSAGAHINSVVVDDGGEYSTVPSVTVTSASYSGTAPQATATLSAVTAGGGTIKALKLINGGSGYTSIPTLTISGGGGTGATGIASIDPIYSVTSYTVTKPGAGYSSAPTVTVAAPTGSGGIQATAVATVGGGATTTAGAGARGAVYQITALAETQSGARSMAQMEVTVTYDQYNFALGGALTLAGSNPTFGTPMSNNFVIQGVDANSCGAPKAFPSKPAIGVYDPTDPDGDTALEKVITSLGKPKNYLGSTAAPSILDTDLGNPTPQDLETFANTVEATAKSAPNGHVYGSNPGSIEMGTASQPIIDVIDGDFSMGPKSGYGILLVRGQLTISGDYDWHGLILVIGKGASLMNGGGNGQITGAVFVANTNNGTGTLNPVLQNEIADWNGGGGNGVQYDHCWADNLLAQIPSSFTPSPNALKVLSQRMLEY